MAKSPPVFCPKPRVSSAGNYMREGVGTITSDCLRLSLLACPALFSYFDLIEDIEHFSSFRSWLYESCLFGFYQNPLALAPGPPFAFFFGVEVQ